MTILKIILAWAWLAGIVVLGLRAAGYNDESKG
jgi:hypothetical protein